MKFVTRSAALALAAACASACPFSAHSATGEGGANGANGNASVDQAGHGASAGQRRHKPSAKKAVSNKSALTGGLAEWLPTYEQYSEWSMAERKTFMRALQAGLSVPIRYPRSAAFRGAPRSLWDFIVESSAEAQAGAPKNAPAVADDADRPYVCEGDGWFSKDPKTCFGHQTTDAMDWPSGYTLDERYKYRDVKADAKKDGSKNQVNISCQIRGKDSVLCNPAIYGMYVFPPAPDGKSIVQPFCVDKSWAQARVQNASASDVSKKSFDAGSVCGAYATFLLVDTGGQTYLTKRKVDAETLAARNQQFMDALLKVNGEPFQALRKQIVTACSDDNLKKVDETRRNLLSTRCQAIQAQVSLAHPEKRFPQCEDSPTGLKNSGMCWACAAESAEREIKGVSFKVNRAWFAFLGTVGRTCSNVADNAQLVQRLGYCELNDETKDLGLPLGPENDGTRRQLNEMADLPRGGSPGEKYDSALESTFGFKLDTLHQLACAERSDNGRSGLSSAMQNLEAEFGKIEKLPPGSDNDRLRRRAKAFKACAEKAVRTGTGLANGQNHCCVPSGKIRTVDFEHEGALGDEKDLSTLNLNGHLVVLELAGTSDKKADLGCRVSTGIPAGMKSPPYHGLNFGKDVAGPDAKVVLEDTDLNPSPKLWSFNCLHRQTSCSADGKEVPNSKEAPNSSEATGK